MNTSNSIPASQPPLRMQDRAFVVAVTGHCHLGDTTTVRFAEQTLRTLLAQMQRAAPQHVVALSGLAVGADTIFAEAALACSIPLEVCLACADITANFAAGRNANALTR